MSDRVLVPLIALLLLGCSPPSAPGVVGLEDLAEGARLRNLSFVHELLDVSAQLPTYLDRNPEPFAAGCTATTLVTDADGEELRRVTRAFDGFGRLTEHLTERPRSADEHRTLSYGPQGLEEEIVERDGVVSTRRIRREGGRIVEETEDVTGDGAPDRASELTWERGRLLLEERFVGERTSGTAYSWEDERLVAADDLAGDWDTDFVYEEDRRRWAIHTNGALVDQWGYAWDGELLTSLALNREGRVLTQWTLTWTGARALRVEESGAGDATIEWTADGRPVRWDFERGSAGSVGRPDVGTVGWSGERMLEVASTAGLFPSRTITWEDGRPTRVNSFQLTADGEREPGEVEEHAFDCGPGAP